MLTNKTMILTGASQGIGAATARRLAVGGANVVLAARSEEPLLRLADELKDCPGTRLAVATDLLEGSQRARLVERTLDAFGQVDVLINNAALGMEADAAGSDLDEARLLFEVNFFAALDLIQRVLPPMRQQGSGQIIQVSSIVGHRATPRQAIYCATKYALNGLSDALRTELVGSGIQVTDIYPGVTATDFTTNQLHSTRSGAWKRAVPPDAVAAVIVSAIETRSRARYIRWQDRAGVYLSRALPGLAETVLGRAFRWRRGVKG